MARRDDDFESALRNAAEKGYDVHYLNDAGDVEADAIDVREELLDQMATADSDTDVARLGSRLETEQRRAELRLQQIQARAEADADRYAARAAAARTEAEAKVLEEQARAARTQAEEIAKMERTLKLRDDADRRRIDREQKAAQKRKQQETEKARAARAKAIRQAANSTQLTHMGAKPSFAAAGLTALAAAVTVTYTATRPGNQSLGFAAFWTLAGMLGMVEGNAELEWISAGIMSANAAYFSLRLFDLVKVQQSVTNTPIPGTGNQISG